MNEDSKHWLEKVKTNREGEGRGDEGAGRRPTALPEHLGAGSPETAGSQACAQRIFLPGPKLPDSAL